MTEKKYFLGASHYFILEGEDRFILEHSDSEDPLLGERIEFKENLLNDLVVRLADADLKINLLLKIKEKHEEEKKNTYQQKCLLNAAFSMMP